MLTFERPIPGQSLTAESKSQAFERPPEITDPIEALDIHIDNLSKDGAMEDVLYFLEFGVDLVTLVQGVLRSAVMEGIHSIDVSLIIAPVLHEHIKGFAEAAKLDYDEGFENEEGKKALSYKRDVARAKQMLKKLKEEESEAPTPEPMETPEPELEMQEQEPVKTGLMARM
tara:strand:- start:33 stop:545 length:513 start_codon:yes stop_codon:yes gene_type:complete